MNQYDGALTGVDEKARFEFKVQCALTAQAHKCIAEYIRL